MISDWWEDNRNRLQIEYSIYDIHIRRINIKEVIYADMGGQIHAFSAFTYTIYKKTYAHDSIFQKQPRSFEGWVAAISANIAVKSRSYIQTNKTSPKMAILASKLEIHMSMTLPLVVSGACAHQSARPSSLAATRFFGRMCMWCMYLVNLLGFILIAE